MTAKRWVEDSAVCVFAAILLALSYEIFIFPNQFAPAGLPGIATMIQHIFKFNAGYMMYLFNIPLLVAMILLGNKEFAIKSAIFSMVFSGALLDGLKRFGFEEVPSLGEQFDPELHNAVMREAGEEPGKILEVFQKGYRVKDKIIRYAMVKVCAE